MNLVKHLLILSINGCFVLHCFSQNLVNNPSFENTTATCCKPYTANSPSWYSRSYDLSFYHYVTFNSCCLNSTNCSVPYNNSNNHNNYHGWQYPHSGNGYVVIDCSIYKSANSTNRTFLGTKLKDSLRKNNCYYIEFYVNLINDAQQATNNIALLVSDVDTNVYYNNQLAVANPQIYLYGNPIIKDTLNWIKVGGIYTAHGGEQYIRIGNFKDDAHTDTLPIHHGTIPTDYQFDDVSVIPLDSMFLKADAGRDTVIHPGDSVFIGSLLCGLTTQWFNAQGVNIANNVPGLWVKPTANTYYILEQNNCGQLSKDTVNITVTPLPVTLVNYALHQQNNSIINTWQTATEVNVSHFNIQRSSSCNAKDFETVGVVMAKGVGKYEWADEAPLSLGRGAGGEALFYRLETVDKDGERMYSEVRKVVLEKETGEVGIFPNPCKDVLTVQGSNIQRISISTIEGKEVISTTSKSINTLHLTTGLYIIKIIQGNNNITYQKFLKQ